MKRLVPEYPDYEKNDKMKTIKTAVCALMLSAGTLAGAQEFSPVDVSVSTETVSDDVVSVIFTVEMADGWHVYSTDMPDDGPVSASITVEESRGMEADGKLMFEGREIRSFDSLFGMEVRYFEKSVKFVQKFRKTGRSGSAKGYFEYAACNDSMCIPPASVEFTVEL